MHVRVQTSLLTEKVQEAIRFISTRASLPALSGIFLSVTNNQLSLRTSTGSVAYQTQIQLEESEDGEALVHANTFLSLLRSFQGKELELRLLSETLEIQEKGAKSEIALLPSSEFPPLPSLEDSQVFLLPFSVFFESARRVLVAASADETKPVLTSLLLELKQPNALVATDGFRLFREELDLSIDQEGVLLLPAKAVREVLSILEKKQPPTLELLWNAAKTQLAFRWSEGILLFSPIQGEFPPYRAIVPAACAFSYSVERELLIQRIRQAMIFAKDVSNVVVFGYEDGVLLLRSQVSVRGKASGTLECHEVSGEPVQFACNGKFVLDFLSSVNATEVIIRGNESLKPVLFGVQENPNLLYLVMPFKLTENAV